MLSHITTAVMPRFKRASSIPESHGAKHDRLWNTGSPGRAGDDTEYLLAEERESKQGYTSLVAH